MKLRHATTHNTVEAIYLDGIIDPTKSKGKILASWWHTPEKSSWAILHVELRHKAQLEEVAIIEAEIPRSWLTRRKKGLWTCNRPVSINKIKKIYQATELAQSPIKGE